MALVQSLSDTRDSQDFLNALVEQSDVTEHVELPCESYSRWLTMSQAALLLRLHTMHTLSDAGCGDVVSSIVNFPHISCEAVTYDIEPISNFEAQPPEFLLSPPLLSKQGRIEFFRELFNLVEPESAVLGTCSVNKKFGRSYVIVELPAIHGL